MDRNIYKEVSDNMIIYKNLSWPLKIAAVSSWVVGILYGALFIIGFVSEITA